MGLIIYKNIHLKYNFFYCRRDLTKEMQHFDYWSDKFETLPMYFMKFHGQELITNVLEVQQNSYEINTSI